MAALEGLGGRAFPQTITIGVCETEVSIHEYREMEAGAVAVRLRTEENLGARPVEEFIAMAQEAVAERRTN